LKSVRSCFGSNDFEKIKIGIGRPNSKNPDVVAGYVLKDFPDEHLKLIREGAYPRILKGINALV
jgi:peptidyl-tRNA hydrolase, PTH1 family